MKRHHNKCCARSFSQNEPIVEVASYGPLEVNILDVARFFWQTFETPDAQCWLIALQRVEQYFQDTEGEDEAGLEILATVQAMRMSRGSSFRFNSPSCSQCALVVSEHERQFMSVFTAIKENRIGAALTHAMILCEGNDTSRFIARMTELVKSVAPVAKSPKNTMTAQSCQQPV